MVGGVGNGWGVALTTLMNERAGLAFGLQVRLKVLLDELTEEAAARGLLGDPVVRERLGDLHIRTEILRLTAYRGLTATMKYGQPGPEGSLTKWMWSETNQKVTELAAELLGPEALVGDSRWSYELLRARGNTIEGGTTEILKNIVAERVLGLPRLRRARELRLHRRPAADQADRAGAARPAVEPRARARGGRGGHATTMRCGTSCAAWAGPASRSPRSTGARAWAWSSWSSCSRSSGTR